MLSAPGDAMFSIFDGQLGVSRRPSIYLSISISLAFLTLCLVAKCRRLSKRSVKRLLT